PYYYNPYAGYLRGAADVIRSYGKFINDEEQARILRETARQAKLDTERKRFDLEMYLRANRPTFSDEQMRLARIRLQQVLTTTNVFEITSAGALNVILDDLRKLVGRTVTLEPIPLSESVLRNINVRGARDTGNLGLLREDGRFRWPSALLDLVPEDKQTAIEVNAVALISTARNGNPDRQVLRDLRAALEKINEDLYKKAADMPTPQFM